MEPSIRPCDMTPRMFPLAWAEAVGTQLRHYGLVEPVQAKTLSDPN